MVRLTVYLSEQECEALHKQSVRDLRGLREQARYLIVRGLGADLAQSVIVDCNSCKFWRNTVDQLGECRKNAPLPDNKISETEAEVQTSFWPITYYNDWCGEFAEKNSNV